ncbi:MAG TPA: DUF58 domain-containing protein [Pseudomonadales bacterium]|nr:DUF58 domain-containing protein [Pseudomonadales bacterium]
MQHSAAPGVYVSIEELSQLRMQASELTRRSRIRTQAAGGGTHQSRFRGRGIDFDEVRVYQPGDDVRNIDWRVTARTGTPHTKLFREERERPVYLVVDQSQSMFFGSQVAFKSVTAAKAAALMAWGALSNHDRIGGCIFSDTESHLMKPREGKAGIQAFFRRLLEMNSSLSSQNLTTGRSRSGFLRSLEGLNQVTRPGSLVILISDFRMFDDIALQLLSLLTRHNDVLALFVYDPMERQLPVRGNYGFSDGKNKLFVDTSDRTLRVQFQKRFHDHYHMIENRLSGINVVMEELATNADLPQRLATILSGRLRGKL